MHSLIQCFGKGNDVDLNNGNNTEACSPSRYTPLLPSSGTFLLLGKTNGYPWKICNNELAFQDQVKIHEGKKHKLLKSLLTVETEQSEPESEGENNYFKITRYNKTSAHA